MAFCPEPGKHFKKMTTPALAPGSMNGKIALVTGGGTGLGRGIATMFARLGAKVAIAARRLDVLQKTAEEIQRETGGVCIAVKMDIKDPAQIAQAFDEIERTIGLPNVLVNNAAGNFVMASQRLSPNAIKTVIDIVLLGSLNVTMELGRRAMAKGLGANVLSITTPYARSGSPYVVPSAASKAGVENFTKSLAAEWARYGFRFNIIAPGPIPTEGAFGRLSPIDVEDAAQLAAERVPLGRVGEKEELANLASFVCSDYGSWINGAIIDFDGGQQFFNHGSSISGGGLFHSFTNEDWAHVEDTIRGRTGKTKSKI